MKSYRNFLIPTLKQKATKEYLETVSLGYLRLHIWKNFNKKITPNKTDIVKMKIRLIK